MKESPYTRLIGDQAELFPNWRYFGFVTDLLGSAVEVDQFHRNLARIERNYSGPLKLS